LVAGGSQPVDGKAVKPDATLTLHNEAAIVWTPVRDFSKIGLQLVQQAHGNASMFTNGFVIKNTAHDYCIGWLFDTNNQSNSLNDC
jgi:hypothetical protein